jgi:hypothetical protein
MLRLSAIVFSKGRAPLIDPFDLANRTSDRR